MLASIVVCEAVVIQGKHPKLKGQTVSIRVLDQAPWASQTLVEQQKVGNDGAFRFILKDEQRVQVYCLEIGIYDGLVFCEAHTAYDLVLDVLDERKVETKRMPVHNPERVILGVQNLSLNLLHNQLASFEHDYSFFEDQVVLNLREDHVEDVVIEAIKILQGKYEKYAGDFFLAYTHYKYAHLHAIYSNSYTKAISSYLSEGQVYNVNNPAYWELMETLWTNYLVRVEGKTALYYKRALKTGDYKALRYIFINDTQSQGQAWVDIAIMQMIYGQKYAHNYEREDLYDTSLSMCKVLSRDSESLRMATSLKDNLYRMMVGSEFPEKILQKADGTALSIRDYQGQKVLLYFFNASLKDAKKNLDELRVIKQRQRNKLRVIAVLCYEVATDLKKWEEQYSFDIEFVNLGTDFDTLAEFEVRDLPLIHIYDEHAKVLFPNAPLPQSGLEAWMRDQAKQSGGMQRLTP